ADRLRGSGGLATLPRLAAVAARLSSHEFSLRRFRMPGPFDRPRPRELERGVVAEAARGAPRVSARRSGGRPRLLRDLLLRAATGLEASATAAGCGPRDLCRRITQRRTGLVNLQLDRRSVVAVVVLVGTLTQPALRDDAHALRQRACHVLGELPPHRCAEEQRFAVLPLVGLTVERARSRGDGEVRHRQTVLRVTQLGVCGEVPHHGDDGFAGHDAYAFAAVLGLRATFSTARFASAATVACASSA